MESLTAADAQASDKGQGADTENESGQNATSLDSRKRPVVDVDPPAKRRQKSLQSFFPVLGKKSPNREQGGTAAAHDAAATDQPKQNSDTSVPSDDAKSREAVTVPSPILLPTAAGQQGGTEAEWRDTLDDAWYDALKSEISKDYFGETLAGVDVERQKKNVFPPQDLVFNAFKTTPLNKVKVVIVGQDPYHGPGQAMGLCFSVERRVKVPPSLVNMFKEIGISSAHGDLSHWARQGVFMLNSLLTVEQGKPMSHKRFGWATFTDHVINIINTRTSGVVFMLWGKPAQQKGKEVDRTRHLVLQAGHPSPLSIKHFAGCGHFEKCNEYLESHGKGRVDWALPA